jgi:hypothetical protein
MPVFTVWLKPFYRLEDLSLYVLVTVYCVGNDLLPGYVHVLSSAEACHQGCPVSISGEPMWDLWWTEWYWYLSSPSTSVSSSNYHFTNAPYSSFLSYTSEDVYELSV